MLGYSLHNITDRSVNSYEVNQLSPKTDYYFTIRVRNAEDLHKDSVQIRASTSSLPTPVTLAFNSTMTNDTKLQWTRSPDEYFSNYTIYQSEEKDKIGSSIGTVNNQNTTFLKVNIPQGKTYYYTVRVTGTDGVKADSPQVSAASPAQSGGIPFISFYIALATTVF